MNDVETLLALLPPEVQQEIREALRLIALCEEPTNRLPSLQINAEPEATARDQWRLLVSSDGHYYGRGTSLPEAAKALAAHARTVLDGKVQDLAKRIVDLDRSRAQVTTRLDRMRGG